MKVKAFIFDMDGTMLDNMAVHMQIWFDYLSSIGVVLETAQFYKFAAGRTNAEILRELLRPDLGAVEILEHSQKKEELYRQHYGPILKPVPGLIEFLEGARQLGIPMAVASSAGCENIQFHLDGLESEGYFTALVGSEDVRNGKPDPEIFLQAARRLGVSVDECLVFEDTPAGLEAAARAGMRAIAVTTTYPAERLAQNPVVLKIVPDYTVLKPEDLLNW
jgi:HAD superfamily hydrolase (TIGR01509 family)